MKTLKMFALIVAAVAALVVVGVEARGQDAKVAPAAAAAPSNDPKDAQIAALKQENAKLTQELGLWKQKYQGLLSVYGADEALKTLEAPTAAH